MQTSSTMFKENMRIKFYGEDAIIEAIKPAFAVLSHDNGLITNTTPEKLHKAYRTGQLEIKRREQAVTYQPLTDDSDIERAEFWLLFLLHHNKKEYKGSDKAIKATIKSVCKKNNISDDDAPSCSTFRRRMNCWVENDYDIIPVIKKQSKKRAPRLPDETIELAEKCIDEYHLKRDGVNKLQTYYAYIKACEDKCIESIMSRSQFYNIVNSLNPIDVERCRKGPDAARRLARGNNGSFHTDFPLQYVEIDAIHPKVGLLDDITQEYIGVPIIYLAICRYTRCILAYSMSYGTSPSELSDAVVELIKKCVSPKDKPEHTANGWPLSGVPYAFVGDAGPAFIANNVLNLMAQLKTTYITTETQSPWRKPFIESFNRTLRSQYCDALPGYARWADERNTDKPVKAMAVLTLSDFIKSLDVYLLDHYHQNPHRGLYGDTPADYCKNALEKYSPREVLDMSSLKIVGGNEVEGIIQPSKGIQKNNIYYYSNQLAEYRSSIMTSHNSNNPCVQFLYDRNDISQITVVDDMTDKLFVVEAKHSKVMPGMSLSEFKGTIPKVTKKSVTPFNQNNTVLTDSLKRQVLTANISLMEQLNKKAKTTKASMKSKCKETPHGEMRLGRNHTNKKDVTKSTDQVALNVEVPDME